MMALSEIFFLAIVLYLLYRFVFNFLLPVVRTTRQVRQQFRNMQNYNDAGQQQGPYGYGSGPSNGQRSNASGADPRTNASDPRSSGQQKPKQPPVGDYIDFEEVK